MLCALLKLGVLKPAGASFADCCAIPTKPRVNAISAPNRHTLTRTFLRRGIAMNVPPVKKLAELLHAR
jgi:hypothetical protein